MQKKSISQEYPMFGYGHFQAYNLFQLTKYCTSSVLRKVFSCAKLFSKVSRATGCQKVEEIWKNAKMLIFRPFAQCSRSLQSARIWSKSSILVLFGPLVGLWYMQSCFPMFVGVYLFWNKFLFIWNKTSFGDLRSQDGLYLDTILEQDLWS